MKLHFYLLQVQRLDFFNQNKECIFQTFLQSCSEDGVFDLEPVGGLGTA